jgi:negative regulator of flagellin synthesis FlgM
MKIQGHNPIEGQELLNRAKDVNKNRDAGQKDNANKADDSKDKITVSGKAKEINELKSLISDLPDIRTDRVDAIKKAIDSGNYNVDVKEVAAKILEEM